MGNVFNIEIKAKCDDHERIRNILKEMNAEFIGTDHQIDTYFNAKTAQISTPIAIAYTPCCALAFSLSYCFSALGITYSFGILDICIGLSKLKFSFLQKPI